MALFYWSLRINDTIYWYEFEAELEITIKPDGRCLVEGDENELQIQLKPFPKLVGEAINQFREMADLKIVPYLDPPNGVQKTDEQLKQLADTYFSARPLRLR